MVDSLYTYYNPINLPYKIIPNINKYLLYGKYDMVNNNQWKLYCQILFNIDHELPFHLLKFINNKSYKTQVYYFIQVKKICRIISIKIN